MLPACLPLIQYLVEKQQGSIWAPALAIAGGSLPFLALQGVITTIIAPSPLLVTEEGRGAWEALGMTRQRMGEAWLQLLGAVTLLVMVPHFVLTVIHFVTCGVLSTLLFPFVWVGQIAVMAMVHAMVALLYETTRSARSSST